MTTVRTLSFRDHVLREWRFTQNRIPLITALVGLGSVLFNHLVLPLFPDRVIGFMKVGFRLEDLSGVVALNDLMAVYFPTFFLGLSSSLAVVILPREEHRLELLLAKPVSAADFVAARAISTLAWTAAVGAVISLASALAIAVSSTGASITPTGTLGGGLTLTGLALVLVAALQIPFVLIREPFQAMLIATAVWLSTSIPTAVLLYRPDLYEGSETLADGIVMPSLIWHDATIAWLGPLLFAAALPASLLLVRIAGVLLARSDIN
jgi:ABC-type transport system involved in multi-copper enzyme maturation permease subunit